MNTVEDYHPQSPSAASPPLPKHPRFACGQQGTWLHVFSKENTQYTDRQTEMSNSE
jgi:hypothetical protein